MSKAFVPIQHVIELSEGDIIRNKGSRNAYVVTANYGSRVTAVNTIDVTNPMEWEVLRAPEGMVLTKLNSDEHP